MFACIKFFLEGAELLSEKTAMFTKLVSCRFENPQAWRMTSWTINGLNMVHSIALDICHLIYVNDIYKFIDWMYKL